MGLFVRVPGLDYAYFFVLGGVVSGVYVVALSLIGAQFRGSALATAITVYTLMWSAGSMVGPPVVGAVAGLAGTHGLPISLVLLTFVFLPFTAASWWRNRTRAQSGAKASR
jgi:MFS family permease